MKLKCLENHEKNKMRFGPLEKYVKDWSDVLAHLKHGGNRSSDWTEDFRRLLLWPLYALYDDEMGTLLHYAAAYNNGAATSLLTRGKKYLNSLNYKGETPLMLAVENGARYTVKILLDANARIDIVDAEGRTALQRYFALSKRTHHSIFEVLTQRIQKNASSVDKLVKILFEAGCSMYHAVGFKDINVTRGLLECGVHIDSRGPCQETALHKAACMDDFTLTRWLLKKKAHVNALDHRGNGPLFNSVFFERVDIVRLLLEEGANPNTVDSKNGWTPLYLTFRNSDLIEDEKMDEIVDLLLQYGAIPQDPIDTEPTLFDHALSKPNSKRMNYLICHLAILDGLGVSSGKSVMRCNREEHRAAFDMLEKYYEQCQKILQSKCAGNTILLLNLLTVNDYKMRIFARNKTLLDTLEHIIPELANTYPFYCERLTKRIQKAVGAVQLEDAIVPMMCKLVFNGQYNLDYDVMREIVGYIDAKEMKNLHRAFETSESSTEILRMGKDFRDDYHAVTSTKDILNI